MGENASGSAHCPFFHFPSDPLLRILALLPPNDLALSGRLACKDAAQHFQGPQHCTAFLGQPLPSHVSAVGTAQSTSEASSSPSTPTPAATATATAPATETWLQASTHDELRQLTFRRKLLLLSRAAASGCETNVELAWQLLQPHVFPEVLQSDYCCTLLQRGQSSGDPAPDVGSVAVASGLAHVLPSLEQRCPGLLDPARTLEAAAKHCDLAGLQAAWQLLGQRLRDGCERESPQRLQEFWKCMLVTAAGSSTLDAAAKMEWVLGISGGASDPGALAQAYGAAAASGDLARVGWLRGVGWGTPGALEAVVEHADLGFIQQMEAEGGYLPPAHHQCWRKKFVISAAAAAPRGSAAKLRWLAGRGAGLGVQDAVMRAAERGNLEAVQLLVEHWRARQGAAAAPPDYVLALAAASGSVPTARYLRQAGCGFDQLALHFASTRGHLPMVRWLAEAGCPIKWDSMVSVWPRDSAADGEGLLEAMRVVAELGSPMGDASQLWSTALYAGHPWAVLQGLLQHTGDMPPEGVGFAAQTGCEATLRALVAANACTEGRPGLAAVWYVHAACNGDLGTLACLRQLGCPLSEGVVGMAVSEGAPLPALRWLAEKGARWGHDQLADKLSELAAFYPSPRDGERREVEAWLRGLLACEEAAAAAGAKHSSLTVASVVPGMAGVLVGACCGPSWGLRVTQLGVLAWAAIATPWALGRVGPGTAEQGSARGTLRTLLVVLVSLVVPSMAGALVEMLYGPSRADLVVQLGTLAWAAIAIPWALGQVRALQGAQACQRPLAAPRSDDAVVVVGRGLVASQ